MAERKTKKKKKPLIMKADDVMPWGKHAGETIRSIFRTDPDYFNYLIERDEYSIPEKTVEILERGIDVVDRSEPTFSKGARLNKTEYRVDDIVWQKEDKKVTLEELFMTNESYYRSLVNDPMIFISQRTFESMMVKKYGPDSVRHYTREELNSQISSTVNGFAFSEEETYADEDITEYIGEKTEQTFTIETARIIEDNKEKDTFGIKHTLRQIYGKNAEFRVGQEEAVLAVLNGKKTLVVQHTGWGKSLVCFLSIKKLREMGKGPAIIISPLLALMHNQIEATEKFGINVKAISSDTQKEWKEVYNDIRKDKIDAIIVSPERLGNEVFLEFIKDYYNKLSLFVVDEAHCISDWGHDFRPDFRRIIRIIRQLPPEIPVLATTATANDRVVRDIRHQLGDDLEILRGTMDRKSICIDVLNLGSDENKVEWLLRNIPKFQGSGIIYCLTIHDCEEVTETLTAHGINADIYHGRLDPEQKRTTEERFKNNEIKVLVATIAFGMGIDKADIAFVIHYQQPASAIAYYQQIGRAGRAINRAYAVLLAGDEDNAVNRYFIMNAFPTENEMESVIECIVENPGLSRNEIMQKLDVTQVWADKVLKYLLVNGDIYKTKARYFKTIREWHCDMKRARIVSWYRWKELRRFNEFIETDKCYMSFIRKELDDFDIKPCGRCANCLKHHFYV